jgi:hypothetical protein
LLRKMSNMKQLASDDLRHTAARERTRIINEQPPEQPP